MNKNRLLSLLVVAVLAASCGVAQAFRPPAQPTPSDFDQRGVAAAPGTAKVLEAQSQAADKLRAALRDVVVDKNEQGGGQVFATCRAGFLTGPAGEGGAVPSARANKFALQDSNRPVKAFLDEYSALFGHDSTALDAARVKREFVGAHNGLRTVVWEQQLDGVPVFEATLIAHTTKQGELVNLYSRFLGDLPGAAAVGTPNRAAVLAAPAVSAVQAIIAAAAGLDVKVEAKQFVASAAPAGVAQRQRFRAKGMSGETMAALTWLPMNSANLRLCWDVTLTVAARGEMFRALVDAQSGNVLLRRCLTQYISDASYQVYTSDSPSPFSPGHQTPLTAQPLEVSRSLVTWGALDTTASPAGWINDGDNTTVGNNVDAHLDHNADDIADPGSSPTGSSFRVFDFPLDLTQDPLAYTNAAVVQLFYLNNWMHDKLYELGFTEAAGNFQTDNFGRGGLGGDAVQADAQDGSGTDNANFSVQPDDGSEPRMQMYIFTGSDPRRDGDLDAEVVLHEYTHGLSNRRVGGGVGMSALQSRGMGEGWSDFYALSLLSATNDNPNACYASGGYVSYLLGGLRQNYYYGIRRYPYSTNITNKNPLTFRDIDPAQASAHAGIPKSPVAGGAANEVHNMGEVWCVTLWEARANLIGRYGAAVGNQLMLQLVTDGMNLSPANPTFLQARDAIIQADQVNSGGLNRILLWTAFAKRGMGASATSPPSWTTSGLVEAFDIAPDLVVGPIPGVSFQGPPGGPFEPSNIVYYLTNQTKGVLYWQASVDQPWCDVSSTGGVLSALSSNSIFIATNAVTSTMPPGYYTASLTFIATTIRTTQVTRTVHLYVGPNYTLCSTPFVWTDPEISTSLSFTGGVSKALAMPFPFNFYGKPYSNFFVTSHGLVGFGDPSALGSNIPLPLGITNQPYAILAPLWSDVDAEFSIGSVTIGSVTWGVAGIMPSRQLIVRWTKACSVSEPSATNTFQVVIPETPVTAETNDIVFQYLDAAQDSPLTGGGVAASIGIQDDAGQAAREYSPHYAAKWRLADAMGLLFTVHPPSDTNGPTSIVLLKTENDPDLTFEVRFDELVRGAPTTNDFVAGGTLSNLVEVTGVSGSGLRFLVTVHIAGPAYGSITLAVRPGVIRDLNGNLNTTSVPGIYVRPFQGAVLSDDMESGPFSWTPSAANYVPGQFVSDVWRWGVPSNGPLVAHSPTHCWGTGMTGSCPNNAWTTLQSPTFHVGGNPVLRYAVWYDFADGVGCVEVFDGFSWVNVTPDPYGFYGYSYSRSGAWIPETVVLNKAQFGNRDLRVRFRVMTGSAETQSGMFIDDVSLSSRQPSGVWVVNYAPDSGAAPGTVSVGFTAYNSTTTTLVGVSATVTSPDVGVTVAGLPSYGLMQPGDIVNAAAPVSVTLAAPGIIRSPVVSLFHSATSTVGVAGGQSLPFNVTNVTAAAATGALWVTLSNGSSGVADWLGRYLAGDGGVASCLFQVIAAGANGIIDPPGLGGKAGGDDQLLYEQSGFACYGRFGVGGVEPDKGRFAKGFWHSLPSGSKVYMRAWDASSADASVAYGDSAALAIGGALNQTNAYTAWTVRTPWNYARDSNGDGVPDGWCVTRGLDPRQGAGALSNAWITTNLATQTSGYPNRVAVWSNYVFVTQGADGIGPQGGQIGIWSRDLGTLLGAFGSSGSGANQFNAPRGLALHPRLPRLAVADTKNNRIVVLSIAPNGALTWLFSFGGSALGLSNNLAKPQGVAIDPDGYYWVADTGNNALKAFDPSGVYQSTVAGLGLKQPQAVSVGSNYITYVADTGSNRVVVLDYWLNRIGDLTGTAGEALSLPSDVQLGVGGRIYVADQDNHRVAVFSSNLTFAADYGTFGSGAGQLDLPRGLWPTTDDGLLYVADTYNNRVVRMRTMLDLDGDGMDDVWEDLHGLNSNDPSDALLDPDGDGVTNLGEYRVGTDPHKFDTNGNGASDLWDMLNGYNPAGPAPLGSLPPHLVALTCDVTGRPVVYGETVRLTATFDKAMTNAPPPNLGLNGGATLSATPMGKTNANAFVLAYAVQPADAGAVNASLSGAMDTLGQSSDPSTYAAAGVFTVTSEVIRISSVAQAPYVVNWSAIASFVYQVQTAPLLPTTNWVYVSTWTSAVNGVMTAPVAGPGTNSEIFYRVRRAKPPW